ncbi:MAG TPA: hypothetical protein PK419_06005 [Spirochaetota bacterium]|nr:hypothetical protein [Spirochaetota bacterium]HOH36101.1 hypothetical protein [Spirochaetota bacterium]HPY01730.1 hypothetical protein [Spirochaetota bacterium]HQA52389.1 hypothetical protein [Spirochaetota bacterium]
MKRTASIFIAALCFFTACTEKSNSSGAIELDGVKIDLPYHYCIKHNDGYRIILLNHNQVSEQEIRNIFRETPENELSITILYDSDSMASSVIADNYRQLGIRMKLDKEPFKIGDYITIILTDTVKFKPVTGKFKDKELTISGSFSAKYLGESE